MILGLVLAFPESFGQLRSIGVTMASIATVLVLAWAAGRAPDGRGFGLTTRPMLGLGRWSYSTYLWHCPLIFGRVNLGHSRRGAALVAVPLSVLLAAGSMRFVEQPAQRVYRKRTAVRAASSPA